MVKENDVYHRLVDREELLDLFIPEFYVNYHINKQDSTD